MGKRLVCHWKELSAVNLITTLLLSLHLSLSLSLLLCFQLLPSLAEPEQAKRESMCERDQCHPHHNQCGIFHQQKIFSAPRLYVRSGNPQSKADLIANPIIVKMFSHRVYVGENSNKYCLARHLKWDGRLVNFSSTIRINDAEQTVDAKSDF